MKTTIPSRYPLSLGAAAALLAGCSASQLPAPTSPSGAAPFAFTHHMTFRYTGTKQKFEVPQSVTRVRVTAVGGNAEGSVIAHGGRVSAVIPVTPSETLAIYVAGAGTSSEGGFNGGGAGGQTGSGYDGNGGGGASDIREGGDALTDRIVVAGGGGGQGYVPRDAGGKRYSRGGHGGARTGGSGKPGCCKNGPWGGGGDTGGTQDQGGSGGKGGVGYGKPGESGQLGSGGAGGSGCDTSSSCYVAGSGGGGGGGYYGGGGGGGGVFAGSSGSGGGGGGGGGSSYVENTASNVHLWRGWKDATGDGLVVISWR
ncbi:MAG TPA: hypothetical protein VHR97_02170 [Candidatus Baltobacteraceae bacterium]|nr:hypothetical protein [Candidatus Baltobacteraceae bacterium]